MERRITDDMQALRRVLPPHINQKLDELGRLDELLEIVMDLGRRPSARYISGEVDLAPDEISRFELDAMMEGIGQFDADNRAGIERTLHRISGIRNRRGEVVGITARVGRAVFGTIDIIQDLIQSGQSVLMMGPPGVGKTTMLREAARVLAETKRVVIVDTSNEIGGDGDVPHSAIGKARRMQVSHPERQHEVMIEAVENHNPQVIVIDEIGRELEAMAARTIAERGVQLIGTAHGNALDNLLLNPTLSDLVGGIQSVTLGDDEARRRGTQKTVLERRAPPTFDVLVEIQTRHRMIVHTDVAQNVDHTLRDRPLTVEQRERDERGRINTVQLQQEPTLVSERRGDRDSGGGRDGRRGERYERNERTERYDRVERTERRAPRAVNGGVLPRMDIAEIERDVLSGNPANGTNGRSGLQPQRVYAYGVARNRLAQLARRLHLPLVMIEDEEAPVDMIVTLKNYYRRRPKLLVDAERRGTPVYVLRANTLSQFENFLSDVFHVEGVTMDTPQALDEAMRETQSGILQVMAGAQSVDLAPQSAPIRRRQHEMANRANLESESYGEEPQRHVRIARSIE